MIDRITDGANLMSIIIRGSYKKDGIEFFTPDEFSQQLAYMSRPEGYQIQPHVHNEVPRQVSLTKEVLFIKSGKLRVDFYNNDQVYLESRILAAGDVILLASGGHGFEMIEPTEMIEVKQGPYVGEEDKVRFNSVDSNKIQIKE